MAEGGAQGRGTVGAATTRPFADHLCATATDPPTIHFWCHGIVPVPPAGSIKEQAPRCLNRCMRCARPPSSPSPH